MGEVVIVVMSCGIVGYWLPLEVLAGVNQTPASVVSPIGKPLEWVSQVLGLIIRVSGLDCQATEKETGRDRVFSRCS